MNPRKYFLGTFILSLSLFFSLSAYTQDKSTDKATAIKNMVDSQNYVFLAQSATPMTGRVRQLTSEYDLKVTRASIVSYLPYYGRAYTATMDPNQAGIEFTSKDFEYTMKPQAKGGWEVTIKPKDYRNVQQMYMTISSNGYTTLRVTSTQRQPISFYGEIHAPGDHHK